MNETKQDSKKIAYIVKKIIKLNQSNPTQNEITELIEKIFLTGDLKPTYNEICLILNILKKEPIDKNIMSVIYNTADYLINLGDDLVNYFENYGMDFKDISEANGSFSQTYFIEEQQLFLRLCGLEAYHTTFEEQEWHTYKLIEQEEYLRDAINFGLALKFEQRLLVHGFKNSQEKAGLLISYLLYEQKLIEEGIITIQMQNLFDKILDSEDKKEMESIMEKIYVLEIKERKKKNKQL